MADRGEDILERMPFWTVVVDVPRGDDRKSHFVGESGQASHPILVSPNPVVLEFHEDMFWPECMNETFGEGIARSRGIL